MLKVVMVRRRKLKKDADLETHKQNVDPLQAGLGEKNVAPLELKLEEQIVVSSELKIDESNNLCGLELTMVIVCNSNDEITPNIDWEFRLKNGGLNCFRIYIH